MNKILFLLLSLLVFASCNNEEELFEMTYETDVVFSAGISQFEIHFQDMFGINTMSEALLVANNRTTEEVMSIVPKEAQLINIQSSQSLDFIQDISIRIFDGDAFNPTDISNITEVFFRENVPQDQRTFINLLPSLPDVKDRLFEERFNISVRSQLRVPPPSTIEARLRVTFAVQ